MQIGKQSVDTRPLLLRTTGRGSSRRAEGAKHGDGRGRQSRELHLSITVLRRRQENKECRLFDLIERKPNGVQIQSIADRRGRLALPFPATLPR